MIRNKKQKKTLTKAIPSRSVMYLQHEEFPLTAIPPTLSQSFYREILECKAVL